MAMRRNLVGARGFEPPTLWSQTRCAIQAALRSDVHENTILVGRVGLEPTEYQCIGFTVRRASLSVNAVYPLRWWNITKQVREPAKQIEKNGNHIKPFQISPMSKISPLKRPPKSELRLVIKHKKKAPRI